MTKKIIKKGNFCCQHPSGKQAAHDLANIDISGHQESFELEERSAKDMLNPMYDLKLHEELLISNVVHNSRIIIRRVPSGWIYEYISKNSYEILNSTFVPYSTDYMYAEE